MRTSARVPDAPSPHQLKHARHFSATPGTPLLLGAIATCSTRHLKLRKRSLVNCNAVQFLLRRWGLSARTASSKSRKAACQTQAVVCSKFIYLSPLLCFVGSSPSQNYGLLWVPIQAAVLRSRWSEVCHTSLHSVPRAQSSAVCVLHTVCFQRCQDVHCEEDHAEQPQVLRTMLITVC